MSEIRTHEVIKFMPSLPRFEPVVTDTSAMSYAKSCDLKYFFRIVAGYRPSREPEYFTFGRAYHKFREVLENLWKEGKDLSVIMPEAIGKALEIHHIDPIAGSSRWDFLTKKCLVASCQVALEHFLKEKKAKKIEVIATEQKFRLVLSDGKTYRGGRVDQLVRWMGQLWGRDFKTTSNTLKPGSKERQNYENGLDPNDQFSCYTWAESQLSGERVQGQIVECLVNTKSYGPKIEVFQATRTPNQIKTWEQTQIAWAKKLDLNRQDDVWPQNEKHCSFCEFHSVCKLTTEQAMISKLKSSAYKHDPYNFEAHTD